MNALISIQSVPEHRWTEFSRVFGNQVFVSWFMLITGWKFSDYCRHIYVYIFWAFVFDASNMLVSITSTCKASTVKLQFQRWDSNCFSSALCPECPNLLVYSIIWNIIYILIRNESDAHNTYRAFLAGGQDEKRYSELVNLAWYRQ